MNFKNLINKFIESYKSSIQRFAVTFGYTIAMALVTSYAIITENDEDAILHIMGALLFSCMLSILLTLLLEKKTPYNKLITLACSLISSVAVYFIIRTEKSFVLMGYAGLLAIMLCLIIWCVYRISDRDSIFAYMISRLFYTGLLVSVVVSGISICIAAFDSLIFNIEDAYKVYLIVSDVALLVLGVNHYLSAVPEDDEPKRVSKAYSVIFNKVSLAIYLLLLVILYIYLIKSIFSAELPRGRINIFSSLALLMFCFYYLSVRFEKDSLLQKYLQLSGLLMIPIMIIQAVAIYIRVAELGLTAVRCLSLVCNLIAFMFVIDSIFIKKVRWLFPAMALAILLATIGPLNVISSGNRYQQAIIEKVLKNYGAVYQDDRLSYQGAISDEDYAKLISAADYLSYQSDDTLSQRQTMLASDEFVSQVKEWYGKDDTPSTWRDYYFNRYYESLEVEGYRSIEWFNMYGEEIDVRVADVSLKPLLEDYMANYRTDQQPEELVIETDSVKIILTDVYISIQNNETVVKADISGMILRK